MSSDLKVVLPPKNEGLKLKASPLTYQTTFKSKVVIVKGDCILNNQHFFISHKSQQDLCEFIKAMHDISRCDCGCEWPFFESFPYKNGEGLIFK